MTSLLYLTLSAVLLAALSFWFSVEEKKEVRIASRMRNYCDTYLERIYAHMRLVCTRYGSGWLLTEMHRMLYFCLNGCLRVLDMVKAGIVRLQRRTIKQAQKIHDDRSEELKDKTSALSEMMAHKTQSALTEKEKQSKKDASLEGRIMTREN